MKHPSKVEVSREFGVTRDFLETVNQFVSLTEHRVFSVLRHGSSLPLTRWSDRSL